MAERKSAKTATQKPAKSASVSGKSSKGFTDEEKGAMRQRVKKLKAAAGNADGERDVLAKIAAMAAPDRALGERLHKIIKASAPALTPRLCSPPSFLLLHGRTYWPHTFTRFPDAADLSIAAMTSWRRTASAKSGTV
jgi:hypothetical protein